jgi:hypothetical protein
MKQSNRLVINVYSTAWLIGVEKCGNLRELALRLRAEAGASCDDGTAVSGRRGAAEMRACSACAGDYEDPDRTVWAPDEPDEESGGETPGDGTEEFPAEG